MYCVGLTGQIASGKSTAASYFAALGIEIISADKVAKTLTTRKQTAFQEIVSHFGNFLVQANGELDRNKLRELIFQNRDNRLWLENLLHPLIRSAILQAIDEVKSPYVIIEIPLLNDKKHYPYLNRILLIQTTKQQQIERFIARDNGTKEQISAILAAQPDENKLHELADDRVVNAGTTEEFLEKITELHQNYLRYAKNNASNPKNS